MIEWRGGFGDLTVANPAANQRTLYFDVTQNKLVEQTAKAAAKGPVTPAATSLRRDRGHLLCRRVPARRQQRECRWSRSPTRSSTASRRDAVVALSGVALSDGDGQSLRSCSSGPKDVDLLKQRQSQAGTGGRFRLDVDSGQAAVPDRELVSTTRCVHNFGWSIVVVTIAINFVLFPLKLSNMKSMRKMQALKPQIDAINAKYKNISLRDPKKARAEPGGDGPLQEARRESDGRLRAHAAADSVLLRVLQGVHGLGGNARRALAVGDRSFAARASAPSRFCRSS